jgi:uncharacterized protein YecE (DUF72 family)
MSVRVGTSGWNYPSGRGTWNRIFYPARRPRGFSELAYYAEHFDTVEVNSTFYRMPSVGMTSSWLAHTPPSFEFSLKLYQKFTHPDMYLARRRSAGVTDWTVTAGDLDEFRAGIEPLAVSGRLRALLMQFPSSFHREPETVDYIAWLASALRDYRLAIELRHHSWSDRPAETRALLREHQMAWVYIDEPKFAGSIAQNLTLADGDSDLLYVRLHGRNALTWWRHEASADRYNYLYTPSELQPFARAANAASARGRRVNVYLNNHYSAKAVVNAAVLKHLLGDLIPGEYPREMVDRYPELRGIVSTAGLPL